MNDQGFIGAVMQSFVIEDKPRLHRRNSWFRDHQMSEATAIRFLIVVFSLAIALIVFSMVRVIL